MATDPDPGVPGRPLAAPRGPSRGTYAKGRVTRSELVDAATAQFAEGGFRTASLRDIAARVGLSHPGLLHHFPTKAALLEAVLARRDETDAAVLAAAQARGEDRVEAIVGLAERNATRPHMVELFATLSAEATHPDHPAHAYFRRRYDDVLSAFAQGFEEWRARGELREGVDVREAARTVVALMDGLQVQWLLEVDQPDRVDMAALLRRHLDTYRAAP